MSSTSIHLKGHATTPIHPDPGSLVNVHTLETKSLINQEFFAVFLELHHLLINLLGPCFFNLAMSRLTHRSGHCETENETEDRLALLNAGV